MWVHVQPRVCFFWLSVTRLYRVRSSSEKKIKVMKMLLLAAQGTISSFLWAHTCMSGSVSSILYLSSAVHWVVLGLKTRSPLPLLAPTHTPFLQNALVEASCQIPRTRLGDYWWVLRCQHSVFLKYWCFVLEKMTHLVYDISTVKF